MGAQEIMPLPPATSPSLVLAHPTASERKQTWALTHPEWGTALSLDEYLHREEYLTTVPLAKAGGVTHWILTTASSIPDQRPVLSSCETLRKRAFFTTPSGRVADGIAHGVGSVFTAREFRGKGYASRMLTMVRDELRAHQGVPMPLLPAASGPAVDDGDDLASPPPPPPPVAFSFLFSDIGKKFYASRGWAAHPSAHLSFTPLPPAAAKDPRAPQTGAGPPASPATPLAYHHLAELCARDEVLLRQRMARMATTPRQQHSSASPSCTAITPVQSPRSPTYVCLPPDLDTLLWHLMREDFITTRLFGAIPSVRGAVWGDPGRRVWVVWTRVYQAAPPSTSPNTLYILRLVVEDEDAGEEYLADGLRALLDLARTEAHEWATSQVQLWNPDAGVEAAMRRAGLEFEVVDREMKSIFSLMWYGEEGGEDVVWVAGEKYNWC